MSSLVHEMEPWRLGDKVYSSDIMAQITTNDAK